MITIYIKRLAFFAVVFMLSFTFTSCDLEVVPPSDIAAENFWKTEKDAWYGLNACYSRLQGMDIWNEMCTDNAHSHKPWEGPFELIQQNGVSSEHDRGYSFTAIRVHNNFLEKVENCEMGSDLRKRMKAEARFLRALAYLNLTTLFGKVPLVTSVLEYNVPPMPRDTKEIVQKFILDELTEIAEILPNNYNGAYLNEKGRITRAAALALKARAALYFGDYAKAEEAAALVISEGHHSLFRVTSLNAAQQKEADEMEQFIDFAAKNINKDKFTKGMFSYENLWHSANANPSNPEYIVTRGYMAHNNNSDWTRYTYMRPSQMLRGYSSYEPMQDLVDAYWEVDGKTLPTPISMATRKENFQIINAEVNGLDQKAYIAKVPTMDLKSFEYIKEFRNRDSRLYVSMMIPFKGWHETDFGTFYYRWEPKKAGVDGNESWTGYSYRKIVALSPYNTNNSADDYPVIRYAEVLLTYAEARIKNKGWDAEVQIALNDLRDRCGMPNVPTSMSSVNEALDFVRNERRIELAAEGHRYHDMRRYGDEYCKKVMTGITYAPNGYIVVDKAWDVRLLLMPIPQSAMDLNPLLEEDQNPGYSD